MVLAAVLLVAGGPIPSPDGFPPNARALGDHGPEGSWNGAAGSTCPVPRRAMIKTYEQL